MVRRLEMRTFALTIKQLNVLAIIEFAALLSALSQRFQVAIAPGGIVYYRLLLAELTLQEVVLS